MRFRVGDLVAEDTSLYWRFSKGSLVYMNEDAPPQDGEAKKTIGIVMSVHKRFPDAFFDIPYYVYKIKWLNAPDGFWDTKQFYEDELELLSRVNHEDDFDPEFEVDMEFEEEGE